jgi:hypothetical protein
MSFLPIAGQVSALVTAGALILSLSYDWGYFQVIGRELLTAMTISDHIASAVAFLPISLLSTIAGTVIAYILGPDWGLPNTLSTDPQQRLLSWGNRYHRFHLPIIGLIIISCIGGSFEFFFGNPMFPLGWPIVLSGLFVYLFIWYGGRAFHLRDFTLKNYMSIILPTSIVVTFLFTGVRTAYIDLSSSRHDVSVTLTDWTVIDNARLLRYIEKGAILRHQDDTVLVPLSQIRRVSQRDPFVEPQPRVCAWFGYCTFRPSNGVSR